MHDIFKDKEKEVKIRRSFNVGVNLAEKINNVAFKNKVTKSEVVEKALIYLFKLLEEDEKQKNEKSE